jgi:hypothetical protein
VIFISHASTDDEFVNQLHHTLHESGHDTWIDHFDVPAGKHWDDIAADALLQANLMILVLSPASVDSHNVKVEYKEFLRLEKPIIPLLLRDCTPPMLIRYLQMLDFRKRGQHQRKFKELLEEMHRIEHPRSEPSQLEETTGKDIGVSQTLLAQVRSYIDQKRLQDQLNLLPDHVSCILPLSSMVFNIDFSQAEFVSIGRRDERNNFYPDLDLSGIAQHISRLHAVIERRRSGYWLIDKDSKNGTFVEQKQLKPDKPMRLKSGMVVHFGDTPMQIFF